MSASPEAILRQVAEALRASDPERAARLAEGARAAGLRHPILWHASAVQLAAQDRHDEALAAFRQADAMPPPNLATKSAMAMSLAALGRHAEAAKALDAAIALRPDLAGLYVQKGWTLELGGELAAARQAHEKAVALAPDNGEALSRLAFLAARRGDLEAARQHAEAALRSGSPRPAARLALAMAALEAGAPGEAERHLGVLLGDDATGLTDRYLARNLMGDVCDRREQTAEAFAHYAQAKALVRDDPRRAVYSPTMMEVTAGLIRAFEARAAEAGNTPPAAPHVFVMGFLRSGTTLIQQVLASRNDATALHERDTLAEAVRAYMAKPEDLDRLRAAGDAELAQRRDAYWRRVRDFGVDPAGKAFVDGTPINTIKLPLIGRLFPAATQAFVVRDPRDVVLSCFRRSFSPNATTNELLTLEGAARFYAAVMTLAGLYRAKLPLRLHQVRLEDVIADFDGEIGRLCAFAGLAWDDAMRGFAAKARARDIVTPSGAQLARGLNAGSVGQWRRYRDELKPVLPILAPWVERFGYPAD